MSPDLVALVRARARGQCECACGRSVPPGELDHFFGRAKAEESHETVWLLSVECHRDKTDNRPNGPAWCLRFLAHCGRHDYAAGAERAQRKLEWLSARMARA